MSCDRRCYDDTDESFEHDDCATCPGRDDGRLKAENENDRDNRTRIPDEGH